MLTPVSPPASPATVANLEAALVARLRSNRIKTPPYPTVAAKLQRLASTGAASMAEIAKAVAVDPALAAAVLGRATSVEHGHAHVATLSDAVQRIGLQQVIQMALAGGLGEVAVTSGPLAQLRREVWRCALLAGRFARDLAAKRHQSPDHAFLAGLLHDFGAVVVICGLEDIAKEVALPTLTDLQWHQLVAKLQVQFGMVVAARWHLPDAITDVIAHHHDPATAPATPLTQLIKIVDRVIAILDRSPASGIGALLEVQELSTDERYAIGAALPEVVAQMDSYVFKPRADAPTNVAPEGRPSDEEWWPVDFDVVQVRHEAYRARRVSANAIELVSRDALPLNWLAEVTLHTGAEPVKLLVNVKSCQAEGQQFVVRAHPFGLGGDQKKQWLTLLQAARGSLAHVA